MRRIIIDTDPGIDDAMALLYALASSDARIEAITVVAGNVPLETAVANACEVLRMSGAGSPPPVVKGAAAPLRRPLRTAGVHGEDGLGGWIKRAQPTNVTDNAAGEILRIARLHPCEATVVALGPLTNIATAFQRDPEGFRLLRDIVFMGGAVSVPGNITATAEFNMFVDPEAGHEVLSSGVPLCVVGLDATRQVQLTQDDLDEWLATRDDERAEFLRTICRNMFSMYQRNIGLNGCYLHDPLAIAVALDPTLVTTQPMKVDVETAGELTRGMTVAERRPHVRGGENVSVCTKVDVQRFRDLFRERVVSPGK